MKKLDKRFVYFIFDLENQICGYFHHHICNQRLIIRGYSKFEINREKVSFSEVHANIFLSDVHRKLAFLALFCRRKVDFPHT